ncbi:MAG: low molecular weight phosphotyrosine protein phosphatase [Clostridia bacterium]|nr:low molecular weight phosphotyrosine protein phosphatase [Clostridia bacterium]
MKKILLVCHGNICRSTMAEFVLKKMAADRNLDWEIASAATSREEIGNDTHPGTKAKLREMSIPFTPRRARQITDEDYRHYDLLIGMDRYNLINMKRFYGSDPEQKLCLLLDFSEHPRDIADPWYTGNFDATYNDVVEGCEELLNHFN